MAMTYINRIARDKKLRKVDAREPLKIRVTRADVTQATAQNSKCCAFACAAGKLPQVKAAYFFLTSAWLEYDGKLVRYRLPPSVRKEVMVFDRSSTMEPGVYHLSAPPRSDRKAARRKSNARARKRNGTRGKAPNRVVKLRHKTANVRSVFEPVG